MTSDPPDLGKGLFGYRKSAVNQILADRDVMLRQAEGRVRAAESKVADLQNELTSMKERNNRMDEQVERLRAQLEAFMDNKGNAPAVHPMGPPMPQAPDTPAQEMPAYPEEPDVPWEEPSAWSGEGFGHAADSDASQDSEEPAASYEDYGSVAAFDGLDQPPGAETFADASDLFGQEDEGDSTADTASDMPAAEPSHDFGSWTDTPPPAAEPMRKVDEMRYQPDEESQHASFQAAEEDSFSSVNYGFSLHPAQPEDEPEDQPQDEGLTEQPVFRGFTESSFDDPTPSEYMAQPAAAMTVDHPANDWRSEPTPSWEATAPSPEWHPAQPVEEARPAPQPEPSPPSYPSVTAPESHASVSSQASDITNRFLTEELKGILEAAEESAARILERARVTSEHQIAQSNRLWREVQAELARFAAWRDQVEPIIRSVHAKVEGVRGQIEQIPEKIRQALAPMADSISMIDSDLAELASASTPPLLLTPSGLDPSSPGNEWQTGDSGGQSAGEFDDHTDRGGGNTGHTGHLAG